MMNAAPEKVENIAKTLRQSRLNARRRLDGVHNNFEDAASKIVELIFLAANLVK